MIKMERLTRYIGGRAASAGDMGDLKYVGLVIEKLAAYEDTSLEPSEIPTGLELANVFAALQELRQYKDAEEQGLLVRLPCKAGDALFEPRLDRGIIAEYRCIGFNIDVNGIVFIKWTLVFGIYSRIDGCYAFDIGKTVFLTREAAETALAEQGAKTALEGE